MKVISRFDLTRQVKYEGISVRIPADCNYLAVSRNGELKAYINRPEAISSFWIDRKADYLSEYGTHILYVDMAGKEFFNTLRRV